MATFLINRSPTRPNFGIPPEASYTGTPINLKDLKIFGSLAFVHVPDEERRKMDNKSTRCIFVGYDLQSKAYRVYDYTRKKIIITRNVVFDEARVGFRYLQEEASSHSSPTSFTAPLSLADSILRSGNSSSLESVCESHKERSPILAVSPFNNRSATSSPLTANVDLGASGSPCSKTTTHVFIGTGTQEDGQLHEPNLEEPRGDNTGVHTLGYPENESPPATLESSRRYPIRERRPSRRLYEQWALNAQATDEPTSFTQAVKDASWREAIVSEVSSILRNDT